jgi:type IV pilus assembly protein PilY1
VRTQGANPLSAVIQPSYRLDHPTKGKGSGTMVDFRVVSQSATSGRYLIVWEDSEQGGDYDSDVTGILEWSVTGNQLSVTTSTLADATANPQGFGYTVSGTNRDGEHFHSGILGFNYADASGVTVTRVDGSAHPNVNANGAGCLNCNRNQPPSMAQYTVLGNPAGSLQDPMWYAAKWGGFRNTDNVAIGTPNSAMLWDAINNKTGEGGADGVPDTYFEVFNPDQLEQSLRRVFESALLGSNAAPAVSSSQLLDGGFKYVASFDPKRLHGDVKAFGLDASGRFLTSPAWSAGALLTRTNTSTRQIISNNQTTGISFDWATISQTANAAYRGLIRGASTDAQAERVVSFVRGDASVEGSNGIRTRVRVPYAVNPTDPGILGPIVNSSPWLQDVPSARFSDAEHPGYAAFARANRTRAKLLWFGAGDGMLHAIRPADGEPVMSYMPETLAPRLSSLTTQTSVTAYVDGSPFTADVDLAAPTASPDWRTYVFSSLGRGGRGVFALDASNISTLAAAASGTNPQSIFKWQFTANDDSDLGYVLSDIGVTSGTGQASSIVKLQNGQFAMVFGNGAKSQSGKSVLFLLPVMGPSSTGDWTNRYYKIELDTGPNNGLSTPRLVDTNNDGMADTAYAGDLQGNLWKVDLSSANPTGWRSAYVSGSTPVPLYIAQSATTGTPRVPITAAPQISLPDFGGVLVSFATGRSVETGDYPRADRVQRVFGIWDRAAFAAGTRALPRGTATLVARTATRLAAGQVTLQGGTIDYLNATPASAKDGWYFNLPGSSEMTVSNIEYRARNLFFTTIRTPNSNGCEQTPAATLYVINPETGLPDDRLQGTVDITVSGVTTQIPIAGDVVADQRLIIVSDRRRQPNTGGSGASSRVGAIGGTSTDKTFNVPVFQNRFQWREIPGLRTLP